MPNRTNDKYLLVKVKAGSGNRIESLPACILYARPSGMRLYVDWSDPAYSNDRTNSFHSFFKCPLVSPNHQFPETDSIRPGLCDDILTGRAALFQHRIHLAIPALVLCRNRESRLQTVERYHLYRHGAFSSKQAFSLKSSPATQNLDDSKLLL